MPKSGNRVGVKLKLIIMYIKIKGRDIYIKETTYYYDTQCQWCGKVIKAWKKIFHSDLSGNDMSCSMSHVKQMVKNKI